MPLSEEELRLLEQMERALVEEDPKFASTLRGTSFKRAARRKVALAAVAFVAGIAMLMSGVILQFIPLGIVGFVVMLSSATFALAARPGHQAQVAADKASHATVERGERHFGVIEGGRAHKPRRHHGHGQGHSGSFTQRMEARWRRRRDERGGF